MKRRVTYVWDDTVPPPTDSVCHLEGRASLVHSLVKAYGLLDSVGDNSVVKIKKEPCCPATEEDLLTFHSPGYLEFLKTRDDDDDSVVEENDFGLGYDCPVFKGVTEFVKRIAGGTLTAVKSLVEDECDVAVNWDGGWHHANRDEASGFCYVNDIVIGIQKMLSEKFSRVIYIDLDVHHGDGVENAFVYSKRVMTVSFHHHEVGYFPGTGGVDDVGQGKGKFYAVNVPFRSGLSDVQFSRVFSSVFQLAWDKFCPDACVVQCGADCLTGDPLGAFNLTTESLRTSVSLILEKNVPTLFLGGGGYNLINTAKAWTSLTAVIVGKEISPEIPEHDHFLQYGPDFDISVTKGLAKNYNDEEYLNSLVDKISCNLSNVRAS